MTDLLNVGVVGLGMGRHHAEACASLPGVRLKAISDASPERLAAVARELNVHKTYQDGHALIERGGLDAVVIAVPNHLHAAFSIRALRSGQVPDGRVQPAILPPSPGGVAVPQAGLPRHDLLREDELAATTARSKEA